MPKASCYKKKFELLYIIIILCQGKNFFIKKLDHKLYMWLRSSSFVFSNARHPHLAHLEKLKLYDNNYEMKALLGD
jgi:hypothetical protein